MDKVLPGLAIGIVLLVVGQFIAMAIAYVKMMHELAFIKGQMTHFVRQVDKVDGALSDLETDVAVIDRASIKTAMDVNHAFQKLRSLRGDECNGRVESA